MRLSLIAFLLSTALSLAAAPSNVPRFAFTFAADNFGPTSVVADASGNTYLAGSVVGSPLIATLGAYQSQNAGGTCYGGEFIPMPIPCRNVFVVKLDPFGNVVFATYLGGSANADADALAVDSQGAVYIGATVVGGPGSDPSVFPITPGAAFPLSSIQGTNGNFAVVAKLNPSGTELEYATVLPGVFLPSLAVDSAGEVFFNAQWDPGFGAFPATPGAYQTSPGNSVAAAVIGKLNASGSALVFGTYLSGTLAPSFGEGIALDSAGNVLTGGTTSASDFPATAGTFLPSTSGDSLYFAKFSADGSRLLSAAFLGPGQGSLTAGPNGDLFFNCWSTSFPVTSGGFGLPSGQGSYLVHVSADGSSVLNSLYLPFSLNALAVDAAGNAYLAGSGSVSATGGAFQPAPLDAQTNQAVVAKIAPDGQLLGASYAGVAGAPAIAVESDGSVVIAGGVQAVDFLGIATGGFLAANFFPALTLENAASYVANTAVPGELVSIEGYGIGPAAALSTEPVNALGGVQVYFDNFPAPLIYAQADLLNVQVPWEIAGEASTQVRILYNGVDVSGIAVPVAAALPGAFYIDNSDGSRNAPANPARPGDYVALYGTGGGAMSPPGMTGASWPLAPLSSLVQPVSVTIGGEAAAVLYAGSAPTLESGFFQVNVRLPADLTPGVESLSLTIGGVTSAPISLSVQ